MRADMSEVQQKILEIAIYFDDFCKEHGIQYYLMGGSALGAIRHKGFIPWDDDFDVFMTYDNYNKFLRMCRTHLDTHRFYLQAENTDEWPMFYSKLRMNNTTFIEEDTKDRKMHKGFYIDIMCLNNTSKWLPFRYAQYLAARLLVAKTLSERGYFTNSLFKKIVMSIAKVVVRGHVFDALIAFVRCLNNKDTGYVGHFFGRADFSKTSFPKEYLGEPRYVPFCDQLFPVPEKVEDYLTLRYGENYMDMPDEKTKAQYPVHAIFYDTDRDYTHYENSTLCLEEKGFKRNS